MTCRDSSSELNSTICRLCLKKNFTNNEMINALSNHFIQLNDIHENLSLQICDTDLLPKTICIVCINKIKNWIEFKTICHNSDVYLRKLYENHDTNNKTNEKLKIENEILKEGETYHCDICLKTENNIFDFLDHQKKHDGHSVFKCDRCSKVFEKREDLVEHDQSHTVPCKICSKLVLPKSLKFHLILHTDTFRCPKCLLRFNNRSTLNTHTIVAHSNIKNHVCEYCGKSFSTKSSLITHLKMHSDCREYQCKQCSYSGRTASSLYIHMSKHENIQRVCDICAKSFSSNRYLKNHVRRCHTNEKRYECNYCKKKFVEKYRLTVHLRIHSGVRPYICNVCEKAFVRSDGLKEHMSTHSLRSVYDCSKCDKNFICKRSLQRHTCTNHS